MKMIYLLKSREKKRKKSLMLLSIPLLFLLLIFTLNYIKPSLGNGAALALARPLLRAKNASWGGTQSFFGYFSSKQRLIAENTALKDQLEEIRPGLLTLNALQKENEELKAEFGRESAKDEILAYVLSHPGNSPYDTFILDAGAKEGAKEGDKIILSGGLAVGYLKEVFDHTSIARLYSSSGEETDIEIPGEHLIVKAMGRGGGNFEIKLPKNITIEKGTLISLPGIEGGTAGVVEAVETDVTQSLQIVIFRSLFNVYEIEKVYIKK